MDMDTREYIAGCQYKWTLSPTRDEGSPYDVDSATVELHMLAPDGEVQVLPATLVSGVWTVIGSPDSGGTWMRSWHVDDSDGPHVHEPIPFDVLFLPWASITGGPPPPGTFYVTSARRIIAGAGLAGGGDLSADVTLSMPDVGVAGTYLSADITVDAKGRVTAAAAGAGTAVYTTLVGDGTSSSFVIPQATHELATDGRMTVQVCDAASGERAFPEVAISQSNGTVTLAFASPPAIDAYRVIIVGPRDQPLFAFSPLLDFSDIRDSQYIEVL